jgi:D-beta-D-heptose 7-phosphate kinase/D-beta-D-heptose 1-phosphate adenosyltransferase
LLDRLNAGGVQTSLVCDPTRSTLAKQRIIADGQLLLRFDQGTTSDIHGQSERELMHSLEQAHAWCDAIVLSDYGYGILTANVRDALAELQCRSPRVIAVDARDYRKYRDIDIQAIKPNRAEALALLPSGETELPDVELVLARGEQLLRITGAPLAAVTLDRDGAVMLERGRTPHRVFARSAASPSAAGAGDTYIAALAVALSAGASAPVAAATRTPSVIVSPVSDPRRWAPIDGYRHRVVDARYGATVEQVWDVVEGLRRDVGCGEK